MEAIKAFIDGMKVSNQRCLQLGSPPVYFQKDFEENVERLMKVSRGVDNLIACHLESSPAPQHFDQEKLEEFGSTFRKWYASPAVPIRDIQDGSPIMIMLKDIFGGSEK